MLHHGDCLDIMPKITPVDAIVTDPPYGLGFMGKGWDKSVPGVIFWQKALAAVKPGAHLLAFGGTRTHHRLMVAIEDAGWELRDTLMWVYATGFPRSLNVAKAISKKNAPERVRQWEGWGTTLKPAWEPIILARKPLEGTVAANVMMYGTGGINIEASRVGEAGRWPANLIHDGSKGVVGLFPLSKGQQGDVKGTEPSGVAKNSYGEYKGRVPFNARKEPEGSASRFFYCAKPSKRERGEGNNHPTVKPLALLRYLTRLITPTGGTVMDPFMGSGSTLVAAEQEGFLVEGIEQEEGYFEIAKRRVLAARGKHPIYLDSFTPKQ